MRSQSCYLQGPYHALCEVIYTFYPQIIGEMDFPNMSIGVLFNNSSPTQNVMVPILNDMVPEDLEYFSLLLISDDLAVMLNPSTANITIIDDIDSTMKPPVV